MKPLELIMLLTTVLFATFIIFLLQPALLSADWTLIRDATRETISHWHQKLMWPSLYFNYILGTVATLFWISRSDSFQSNSSKNTLKNIALWWTIFCFLLVLSLLFIVMLSLYHNLIGEKGFMAFFSLIFIFSILDVFLIYWLPTALSTPKTMRYLPPASRMLRSFYEG